MNKARVKILAIAGLVFASVFAALMGEDDGQAHGSSGPEGPVGLSLFFQNGQMAPITSVGDAPRFLQEIDLTATVETATDEGIRPIIQNSDFSSLNWRGVKMVEEEWRPAGDGTFIRQRFFRGAVWMEQESRFFVLPADDQGRLVDSPMMRPAVLIADAGTDNRLSDDDDGFVRRFVARQIATGCQAIGDCSGARFIAQGLAQLRIALHGERRSVRIPPTATRLRLKWSQDRGALRTVIINRARPSDFPFGYGFAPSLTLINPPANGSFYLPGESLSLRVALRDGQGARLHHEGSLPSYGEFLRGEVASGLRYFGGFDQTPTLYYALKHREGNSLVSLSGPLDRLRTPQATIGVEQFFLPQTTVATAAMDGFSGVAAFIPPGSVLFNPALWDTPITDVVNLTIPQDALPGTYVATLKFRREFGGEALNRSTTIRLQVGTPALTAFNPSTGNCSECHNGASALGKILHGLSDRSACYSCHASLAIEPDNALDIRVHAVHDRSNRFPGNVRNCALCHLTPPDGPARGLLGR